MHRLPLTAKPRNVFDQFDVRENRLTHALAVTLDQDRKFLATFLRAFAPKVLPNHRQLAIAEQRLPGVATGQKSKAGERGLPDALILAQDGRALALEIKLTANVRLPQLRAHTTTLERRLTLHDSEVPLRCVKALLITADEPQKLPRPWSHVSWTQVYDLLCRREGKHSAWSRELLGYLELVEKCMTDEEVGNGIRLTRFNGIPFARGEEYTYLSAKRVLRLLVSELKSDARLLKALRLPRSPATRDSISDQPILWDFLSPRRAGVPFNAMPHFTIGIGRERAEALLTVPNAARSGLRRIGIADENEFANAVEDFLRHLRKTGALRAGAVPRILMQQRRYPNMRAIPLTDGRMEFDPRLAFPKYAKGAKPRLHSQPEWLRMAHQLLADRSGNLQFQIGCVFDYRRCKLARSRELLGLYRAAWEAGKIFLDKLGVQVGH